MVERTAMVEGPFPFEVSAHPHVVVFFETEGFLVDTVSGFVGPVLRDGDAAIVIATATHRSAFEAALSSSGIDVAAAVAADRYVALDPAELLETFMVDGAPEVERYRDTILGLIERAAADGRRVRVYGEMGAVLWDAGDVASAIALEDLSNDLEATQQLAILCAYPIHAFEDERSAAAFKRICAQHSTVIASEAYSLRDGADGQQREVARLQQENGALRAEVVGLRAAREIIDELAHGDALTDLAKTRAARQVDTAEQLAHLGSWEWQRVTHTYGWSDNLYGIFGVEPGEISPTTEYLLERTHPDDQERVARYFELRPLVLGAPPIEFRIQRPSGDIRYLRSTVTKIDPGPRGARRIVGVIQDVTDQRIATRRLAAHIAVSAALTDWGCFEDGAMGLLHDLGAACEFMIGALWLPRGDVLAAELMWSDPTLEISRFVSMTLALRLPLGVSLPGLAWQSKSPETFDDVSHEPSFRRRHVARAAGLHGAVALPAVHQGEVLAVLEFYSREQDLVDGLRPTFTAIGSDLGEFFSRRRGELGPPRLSPRELQILQLAALGNKVPQITESLSISTSTVKTHMENIYRKLDVSDRAAAVAAALRLGIIR
jgi:DNA-binding CsgD family transcriptional regulator/PAS domain-containing protein